MATCDNEIVDEDIIIEFVKQNFPQFTENDNNILSENEIMELLMEPMDTENKKKESDDDDEENKLIIDEDNISFEDLPLSDEMFKILKNQEIHQSLDLSDCVIREYQLLDMPMNLVHINLSNSYGVEDEETILCLLRMNMTKMEYLDISYIQFRNPQYSSKQVFANTFWQYMADYTIYQWPNLQTITAYGYPLKNTTNALTIAQKVRNINATVLSARTALFMLKKMPEQTANASNLCNKWSGLICKTQYTNNTGGQVDDEFVSTLVPSFLNVDVDRIEGEVATSMNALLMKTPLDVCITIAFPFFVAKSSSCDENTPEEVQLLMTLCQEAFRLRLDEKYAVQVELFLNILIKGNYFYRIVSLYNQKDENGYNIFMRRFSGSNSNDRRLLANVENCIRQRIVNT